MSGQSGYIVRYLDGVAHALVDGEWRPWPDAPPPPPRVPITKAEAFMRCAEAWAQRSHCARMQVGAVITDAQLRGDFLAIGYNGNYAGGPNTCDSPEPGRCGCLHAEVNALSKPRPPGPAAMFCTLAPCLGCAKLILGAAVVAVFYRDLYRDRAGLELLEAMGVAVAHLPRGDR